MESLDELLARWVLNDLPPEAVPGIAVNALADRCEASEVAVLSGLRRPTRADVEDELPSLLRRLGVERPTRRDALKTVVDACAQRMVDGSVAPGDGARRLEQFAHDFWTDADVREQLICFVWDNDEGPLPEAAMVRDAQGLLERGGLRVA